MVYIDMKEKLEKAFNPTLVESILNDIDETAALSNPKLTKSLVKIYGRFTISLLPRWLVISVNMEDDKFVGFVVNINLEDKLQKALS